MVANVIISETRSVRACSASAVKLSKQRLGHGLPGANHLLLDVELTHA